MVGQVQRVWGCPQWAHTEAAPKAFLVAPLSPTPLLGGEGSPSVLLSRQDRDNSPSSCAGLFIASHIGFDWPGVWVHLDIAAPVHAVSLGPCGCHPLPYEDTPLAGQLAYFPTRLLPTGLALPPAHASESLPGSSCRLSSSETFCVEGHTACGPASRPAVVPRPLVPWSLGTVCCCGGPFPASASPARGPGPWVSALGALRRPGLGLSVAGQQEGAAGQGLADALSRPRDPPRRGGLAELVQLDWQSVSTLPFACRVSVPLASAWPSCWHSLDEPLRTLC